MENASAPSSSAFLRLPAALRHRIYTHLFTPPPTAPITTINYTLSWPHLDNPSNTTFALPQLSRCRCPRRQPRSRQAPGRRRKWHMYSRHECTGPNVSFQSARGGRELWVLERPGGMFNVLRPAREDEGRGRGAAVLRTCRLVYGEAVPVLYSGANFLLLTGPCPRGRYQAYATKVWLEGLGGLARGNVGGLSLICQEYEEDCDEEPVGRAYGDLVEFVLKTMPGLRSVCLNVWDERRRLMAATAEFAKLCGVRGMGLCVGWDWSSGLVDEFCEEEAFLKRLHVRPSNADEHAERVKEDVAEELETDDAIREDEDTTTTWSSEGEEGEEVNESVDFQTEDGVKSRGQRQKIKEMLFTDSLTGKQNETGLDMRGEGVQSAEDDWVLAKFSPTGPRPGKPIDENWELV